MENVSVKSLKGYNIYPDEMIEIIYRVFNKEIIIDILLCLLYKQQVKPHWTRITQKTPSKLKKEIEMMFGFYQSPWGLTWSQKSLKICLNTVYDKIYKEISGKHYILDTTADKDRDIEYSYKKLLKSKTPFTLCEDEVENEPPRSKSCE